MTTLEEEIYCCSCKRGLSDYHFQLLPRNNYNISCHSVCPDCFGNLHANRGCSPYFDCPSVRCKNVIIGHHCHCSVQGRNANNEMELVLSTSTAKYKQPDKNIDAIRIYQDASCEYQEDHITIVTSFFQKKKKSEKGKTIALAVNAPIGLNCEEYDNELQNRILAIARAMYHILFSNLKLYYSARHSIQIDTIEEFQRFALQDPSFIVNFFIQLWTGLDREKLLLDCDTNCYQKANYIALYTGVEQMLRSRTMYPGVMQSAIQRMLKVNQANKQIVQNLCKLRIGTSRERARLEDIKKISGKLLKGWNLKGRKYGLIFVMYDNLGFRIRGAQAGYDQYIVIAVVFISPQQLIDMGFYRSPTSILRPICRIRKDWEDIRHSYEASDILPKKKDYDVFGTFMYTYIDSLLKIINGIPKVKEVRILLEEYGSICIDVKLSGDYGTQVPVEMEYRSDTQHNTIEVEQNEQFTDEEIEEYPTLLNHSGQEVKLDIPMHANLAKNKSVENLSKGVLTLREEILSLPNSSHDPDTPEVPIMEDHGAHQGSDGAPSYAFHTLRDQNPSDYKNTEIHSGPFHKHLKTLNALGKMFSYTHLWSLLHGHRDTDKKKMFYLFPGDPGQTLYEQPEMTAPHYVAAARTISRLKDRDISPIDVHDWMLRRAKQHDVCHSILMWLHFVEITNMIQMSEGMNNPELYRTGATLALLLFAKTHCTKYVRIAFEEFIWWQTSSEADKKLKDTFYFTKTTKKGKTIFFDRFVEWINKDIRSYLGKFAKPNQDLLMTRTVLLMQERLQRKGIDSSDSFDKHKLGQNKYNDTEAGKNVSLSPIFCYQLSTVYAHNFWGDGPLRDKYDETIEKAGEGSFYNACGDTKLNQRLLFLVTDAETALMQRFEECHLVEQSERKVLKTRELLFRKTPSLSGSIEKEKEKEICLLTSTKKDELSKFGTVQFIKERVACIRESYDIDIPPDPLDSTSKDGWVNHLVQIHQLIISNDREYISKVRTRINLMYAPTEDHKKKKKKELRKPFYEFSNQAKRDFISKKYNVDVDPIDDLDVHGRTTPARKKRGPYDPHLEATPQLKGCFSRMSLDPS